MQKLVHACLGSTMYPEVFPCRENWPPPKRIFQELPCTKMSDVYAKLVHAFLGSTMYPEVFPCRENWPPPKRIFQECHVLK